MVEIIDTDDQPQWADTLHDPQPEEQDYSPDEVPESVREKPEPQPVAVAAPVKPKPPPFEPAATIEEAEEWARSQGIHPAWRSTGEPDDPYKIKLDDINGVHQGLHEVFAEYPRVKSSVKRIGTFYALDRERWLANYEIHMDEDRQTYERQGKRWREKEADKRVRKMMVDEPTFTHDEAKQEYSIFRAAHWDNPTKYGRPRPAEMAFNQRRVVMVSYEKSEENRYTSLQRGDRLYNVGEDYYQTAKHEFGHAIDDFYGITDHPKFKALHASYSEKEIESGISSYAKTNIHEFLAEGFAEGVRPDARPMGKQVKDLLDEIIRESKKGWRCSFSRKMRRAKNAVTFKA